MALTTIKTGAIADDAVTTDKLANAINTERTANTAKDLTALSASNLTSGTVPDARFPATLPAASAANLTAVPAANITGTLPAISATNLTNIPAANITGTLPAISGANLTNLPASGQAHNLIINGAMQVAQRGTSSTSQGYGSVDRFRYIYNGTDEAPTQAQADVAAGTTPYTSGFRKSFKVTNGNQTGGAGGNDYIMIRTTLEAQDIANSGWNYVSSSSNITLSFWVKSSVAQNFYGHIRSIDGTGQRYAFETGSLSADTWTKVTKTIPGNSNLQFDNNVNEGLHITIFPFFGTNYTDSGVSLNTWGAYAGDTQTPDNTSTWYTTNDATFEITGVQLEVGDTASDFAHESYAETLAKCQRYFELVIFSYYYANGYYEGAGNPRIPLHWNVEKRATPTITLPTIGTSGGQLQVTNSGGSWDTSNNNLAANYQTTVFARLEGSSYGGGGGGVCSMYYNGTNGSIQVSAEL